MNNSKESCKKALTNAASKFGIDRDTIETILNQISWDNKQFHSIIPYTHRRQSGLMIRVVDEKTSSKYQKQEYIFSNTGKLLDKRTIAKTNFGESFKLKETLKEMVVRIIKEETFNIDRTKNIIGKEVYDAISTSSKQQLEKWLRDLSVEIQRETSGTNRYNKLKHEEQFIKYRLEIKNEQNYMNESKQSFNEFDDPDYERIYKTDIQVGDIVVSGYHPHRPVKIGKVTGQWAIPDPKYNSLNIWQKTLHGNVTRLKGNLDHEAAVYRKKS